MRVEKVGEKLWRVIGAPLGVLDRKEAEGLVKKLLDLDPPIRWSVNVGYLGDCTIDFPDAQLIGESQEGAILLAPSLI